MIRRSLIAALYAAGATALAHGIVRACAWNQDHFAVAAFTAFLVLSAAAMASAGAWAVFPAAAALLGGAMASRAVFSGQAFYGSFVIYAIGYAVPAAAVTFFRFKISMRMMAGLSLLCFSAGLATFLTVDLISTMNQIVMGVCGIGFAEVMRTKPGTVRPPKP